VSARRLAPPPGTEEAAAQVQPKVARQTAPARLARLEADDDSIRTSPVKPTRLYIQAGAFLDIERASILSGRLSALGPSEVTQVMLDGDEFFRVRVGPIPSVDAADQTLEQVIALGHPEARIIVVD
jgi:rare lipoprotein A